MSRIFFDTNLFIYLLQDSGETGARVTTILERISERRDDLLTSTLTLAEVLVKPLAAGDVAWADRYEKLLNTPGVEEAHVQIVWDPSWHQSMISEAGRKTLGLE